MTDETHEEFMERVAEESREPTIYEKTEFAFSKDCEVEDGK